MKRYVKATNTDQYDLAQVYDQCDKLIDVAEAAFPDISFKWYVIDQWSLDTYGPEATLQLTLDRYLTRDLTVKNIFNITSEVFVQRIQKLIDRSYEQIEKSPRKHVYDVCKLMGWRMPVFIDKRKDGYKANWYSESFRVTQDDVDYINEQLGLSCYLTKLGDLVVRE